MTGNLKGKFAVYVKHPQHMIFEPNHNPIPRKEDGGIDLTKVTKITILKVKDYHGRK